LYAQADSDHTEVALIETDRVDMREHLIDFGKQPVITKDTVQIDIDALVYFRIVDPRNAVYRVQNLPDAVEFLTQSTLRDIIARMTLDDTFSSREVINADLL
jgi:regulator of protease activity HflC (stomatin/prohibitin superfamily)